MICISNKYEVLLLVPNWHFPMPRYLCYHLRTYMYTFIPFSQYYGKDSLMIFISYRSMIRYTDAISLLSQQLPLHNEIHFELLLHKITFLELIIYEKGYSLLTRLYTKPTERHMYLCYTSVSKTQYHNHNF